MLVCSRVATEVTDLGYSRTALYGSLDRRTYFPRSSASRNMAMTAFR